MGDPLPIPLPLDASVINVSLFGESKKSFKLYYGSFEHQLANLSYWKCEMYLHCTAYRSDNFIVGMTDVSPSTAAPTLWNYDVCGQYPGAVPAGATVSLPCRCNMAAHRYLVLQFPISPHYGNFCELEVFVRGEYCCCIVILYVMSLCSCAVHQTTARVNPREPIVHLPVASCWLPSPSINGLALDGRTCYKAIKQ